MSAPWERVIDDMKKMLKFSLEENDGIFAPTIIFFDGDGEPEYVIVPRQWDDWTADDKHSALTEPLLLLCAKNDLKRVSFAMDSYYKVVEGEEGLEKLPSSLAEEPTAKDSLLITLYDVDEDEPRVVHLPYHRDDHGRVVWETDEPVEYGDGEEGETMNSWLMDALVTFSEQRETSDTFIAMAGTLDESIKDEESAANSICRWLAEKGHLVATYPKGDA